MSSVLLGGPPDRGAASPSAAKISPSAQGAALGEGADRRGNTVTVIAGVGVLLLAMGVGVLIGRSGASRPAPAPPQVISVAAPGATTGLATTPTTTTPTTTTPKTSSKGSSSSENGSTKGSSGAGSSASHPAPPAVVEKVLKKGGKSYEEKSKNLPNVVSTG
jgi:hypothetical protein